jgi:hypothetical protein
MFRGANLCGANLSDAALVATKFQHDDVVDDGIPDAIFDESTVWPDDFDRTALPPMIVGLEPEASGGEASNGEF